MLSEQQYNLNDKPLLPWRRDQHSADCFSGDAAKFHEADEQFFDKNLRQWREFDKSEFIFSDLWSLARSFKQR